MSTEMRRIVLTLTVVCALSAGVLGLTFIGTERYAARARRLGEERAVAALLDTSPSTSLTEIDQFVDAAAERVVYRARPYGDEAAPMRTAVFTFDGERVATATAAATRGTPAGRIVVASDGRTLRGFVLDNSVRGYKNRVRFLVALDASFTLRGVRVLEHEEDPGLGAEIATSWFAGQFVGRPFAALARLDVTRDPLPEDWSTALSALRRMPVAEWRDQHAALLARESARPIYAVTGATISSRALTSGVRTSVEHFARRWSLIGPWAMGDAP